MKKTVSFLLIIAAFLSLFACSSGETYPPVESTELEAQTALTLSVDGKQYTIRYELYRALFLSYKSVVDGGDASVWSGPDKDRYVADIEKIIIASVSEIYSVIHLAEKIGIDVYSEGYDEIIEGYIKASVEGGYYDEILLEGFGGNYDDYLKSLKDMNLNYSVQDLLLRYSLAYEAIYDHYAGTLDSEFIEEAKKGALEYTRSDVEEFYYNSEECVRVIRAYLPKDYTTADRVAEIRKTMAEKAAAGDNALLNYVIGFTSTSPTDVENGMVIGRHSLDKMYYSALTSKAFSLGIGEVSEVVEVATVLDEAYIIMYRIAKNNSHFEDCYDDIAEVYIQNEIGKILDTCSTSLAQSATYAPLLEALDRSAISME